MRSENNVISQRTLMVVESFLNWITMINKFYLQLKKELSDAILAAEHERNTFKAEVWNRFNEIMSCLLLPNLQNKLTVRMGQETHS